jgi:hypothetical protein
LSSLRFLQFRTAVAATLIVSALIPALASARQTDPGLPTIVDGVTVVAPELEGPRGFLLGPDGQLFVALTGSGGANRGSGLLPDSPLWGGLTASVVLVDEGCTTTLAADLPSVSTAMGRSWGVADLAVIGDQLYALVAGGGAAYGNRDEPNGIYRIESDSTVTLIADLSAWQRENPVAVPPKLDRVPDGMPFSIANIDGELWVTERHHGQLIRVGVDGAISRIVDFSSTGLVPAGITPSPLGGAYVAIVGPPPYPADTSKVISVSPDGAVSDVWTGLTAAADVAVDLDGTLYALELGVPQSLVPPYLAPQSGRVVRQLELDASQLVARDLPTPSALEIGADGGIYVSLSANDLSNQLGTIIRIDPALEAAVTIPAGPWQSPTCDEEVPLPDTTE